MEEDVQACQCGREKRCRKPPGGERSQNKYAYQILFPLYWPISHFIGPSHFFPSHLYHCIAGADSRRTIVHQKDDAGVSLKSSALYVSTTNTIGIGANGVGIGVGRETQTGTGSQFIHSKTSDLLRYVMAPTHRKASFNSLIAVAEISFLVKRKLDTVTLIPPRLRKRSRFHQKLHQKCIKCYF